MGQQALTRRDRHEQKSKAEHGYLASVKVDDLVRPVDPRRITQEKCAQMKGYLVEQMQAKQRAEKQGDGKFFGMTDEEILMNQDLFRQMGLLS